MGRDWLDLYLVHDKLRLRTNAEVDAAEATLGVPLPSGYRELVTTLGDGVISDELRVFSPTELEESQQFFQEMLRGAWSWNEPDEVLTASYASQSINLADSLDGDMVIFHPGTGRLHVLPRHYERTYFVGNDLWAVVDWFQDSGVITRRHPFRFFESFCGPTEGRNGGRRGGGFRGVTAAIAWLRLHDAVENAPSDCTFFVKAIGGYVRVHESRSGDLYVHLRYQTDMAPEVRQRIQAAVGRIGVRFSEPWSMSGHH